MRRIVLSLVAGLAVVAAAEAQFPVNNVPQPLGPSYAVEVPTSDNTPYVGPLWTVNVDYLLWFLKPHNFVAPVVGSTTDPNFNLITPVSSFNSGSPNYVELVGPGARDRGPNSGVRLTLTRALPLSMDRCVYTELGFLWLPEQGNHRRVASTPDGNPALVLPFQNPEPSVGPVGGYSLVLAGNLNGTPQAGTVDAHTSTQLWGAEWNITGPLFKGENFGLEALIGLRYLGMADLFELTTASSFGGGMATYDRFSVINSFYGGQAGFRMLWSTDRWGAMFATKVGMGDVNSNVKIRGNSTAPAVLGSAPLPGGFYTSAANIGSDSTDRFGVMLDLNAGVRFAISQAVGVSVGYNFLYWSGVMRASEQVTGVVNPNYNAILNSSVAPLTGTPEPRRVNEVSDFWAHGLNFTLDLRF